MVFEGLRSYCIYTFTAAAGSWIQMGTVEGGKVSIAVGLVANPAEFLVLASGLFAESGSQTLLEYSNKGLIRVA